MLTEQPSGPNGTMTIRSFHVEAVQKRTGRDQFSNSYTLSISIAFIPLNSPHRFHSTITIFHSVNLKTNSVSTVFRFWITAESRQERIIWVDLHSGLEFKEMVKTRINAPEIQKFK